MDAEIASEFQNLIFRKTVKTPRRFFRGVGTYTDALKLSGCMKDEFSAWMKQFHPDYKI